jgi:hypothetical protein
MQREVELLHDDAVSLVLLLVAPAQPLAVPLHLDTALLQLLKALLRFGESVRYITN